MKGWIEVHNAGTNQAVKRAYQVANIRWISACNNDEKKGSLQTVGDDFIVVTRESYQELRALIEQAQS